MGQTKTNGGVLPYAGYSFQDQVFSSDGSRLVEAAHINTSGEGDSEGFGAEDRCKTKTRVLGKGLLM